MRVRGRLVVALLLFTALGAAAGARFFLGRPPTAPYAYVADTGQPAIVCLGDSATAGHGAPSDQSYPAWLQERLTADHLRYRVINSGADGDRVANGLARLKSDVLSFHPVLTIVELGSNDPGHTPASVWESQLDMIVSRLQAHGSRVILGGLDEPGMGDIYRRVAAQYHVPLVWFTQKVVTLPQDWSDAHHPNGAGYKVVMQTFWPTVRSVLGA